MALAIDRILSIKSTDSFRFIWHGGEPLLAGIDFFRKAVAAQEYLKNPDQKIKNYLQTNGTLLTKKVPAFLEEFNFTVGVSLDGPEELHDAQRPLLNGRPTFARTMKTIKKWSLTTGQHMYRCGNVQARSASVRSLLHATNAACNLPSACCDSAAGTAPDSALPFRSNRSKLLMPAYRSHF